MTRCRSTFRELGAPVGDEPRSSTRWVLPLLVKPAVGGSSLGVAVVRTPEDLPPRHGRLLRLRRDRPGRAVRRRDRGRGVGGRDRARADRACRPWRSCPTAVSTTTPRATPRQHRVLRTGPARRRPGTALAETALAAHAALGLRDLSRTDLVVDPYGRAWFLETNVAPGMTETSLFPQAVTPRGRTSAACGTRVAARRSDRPRSCRGSRGRARSATASPRVETSGSESPDDPVEVVERWRTRS